MAYAKSAVSSQQIIDAAIRVLARQGYAKTSLLEIAKEAGMSKGALHYHYPTKEALIHAVLETACNVVQARTVQAWSPSDNPFEALRKTLEELWATRAERTDEALVVADLIALSLYDDSLRPKWQSFMSSAPGRYATTWNRTWWRSASSPGFRSTYCPAS
ncbi:MAG: TetR/AcrR family transcriptional regulator [Deltaproteobacteria bacterium]|nr:TetR/AcrR family transcriptional regulator [Deltaproteobacteria bacterium]